MELGSRPTYAMTIEKRLYLGFSHVLGLSAVRFFFYQTFGSDEIHSRLFVACRHHFTLRKQGVVTTGRNRLLPKVLHLIILLGLSPSAEGTEAT